MAIVGDLLDGLGRQARALAGTEQVVRLGVTGLSRAGKTVLITSLVANLLDRARMAGLRAEASGRIAAVYLQPQPDDTVPRFDYERHLAALTGPAPRWPEGTRAISELRLSFRLAPSGLTGFAFGPRILHLDIVDYPGEWLLDLTLLDQDYGQWSARVLDRLADRPEAEGFRAALAGVDPAAALDEPAAGRLAAAFTDYLHQARDAGYADCAPGRFLLPGDLAGSPALTFCPLPAGPAPRGSLARECARRFAAYQSRVVEPFFRDHFARIDRQLVLVDMLGSIHAGPRAVADLRQAMAAILTAFRPGRAGMLARLLGARRVERILFAATKADHLHHSQHARLSAILAALMHEARARADFAGADTAAMAIAALRTTVEESVRHDGVTLDCVRGRLADGREAAFHAGDLPASAAELMAEAEGGAVRWLDQDYGAMRFLPQPPAPGARGLPHVRLDKAVEFLLGDILG